MSYFGSATFGILWKYKKDLAALAAASRVPESMIQQWQIHHGPPPTPGQIIKLARAFAQNKHDLIENHLILLYAHLKDYWDGPAAQYLNIEILPTAVPFVASSGSITPIRRSSELDLEAIRRHIWYNETLQKSVRELAKPLRGKRTPQLPT